MSSLGTPANAKRFMTGGPPKRARVERVRVVAASDLRAKIGGVESGKAPADRLEAALVSGEKVHPQYRRNIGRGAVVCWKKVPYSRGAWSEWSREARLNDYPVLMRPDGPIHLAGEHLSYLTGWQEGAALSAHESVRSIAEQVKAKKG